METTGERDNKTDLERFITLAQSQNIGIKTTKMPVGLLDYDLLLTLFYDDVYIHFRFKNEQFVGFAK